MNLAALSAPTANISFDSGVADLDHLIIAGEYNRMFTDDGPAADGMDAYFVPASFLSAGMPVIYVFLLLFEHRIDGIGYGERRPAWSVYLEVVVLFDYLYIEA